MIAINGETLRRSFDRAAGRSPRAVVTAFASASRCVIGQEAFRCTEGDSAILAARALLRCPGLSSRLVTADAIHCQNETAQIILDRGGDYLLRLKGNRPDPHEAVSTQFDLAEICAELPSAETTDADHGRIEVRRAWVSHGLSWLPAPGKAAGDVVVPAGLTSPGI